MLEVASLFSRGFDGLSWRTKEGPPPVLIKENYRASKLNGFVILLLQVGVEGLGILILLGARSDAANWIVGWKFLEVSFQLICPSNECDVSRALIGVGGNEDSRW